MARHDEGLLHLVRALAPSLLSRTVGWGAVTMCLAAFAWTSPWSPASLLRADVLLGEGDALAAVGLYDQIARANPSAWVRAVALERAASVWQVELSVPREARDRLERLVWYRTSRTDTADVLARVAKLLQDEGDFAAAAVRFREAHDLAPMHPNAGDRLSRAATAADHAGDPRLADALWKRLGRTHPEYLARAELARGTLALHRGEVRTALAAFQRAERGTFDPDVSAGAALGATVCLARLGDLPGGLRTLDEADLPPEVSAPRVRALEARDALHEPKTPPPAP